MINHHYYQSLQIMINHCKPLLTISGGTAPGLGPPTEPASRGLVSLAALAPMENGGYNDLMVGFYTMGFI